MRLSTSALLWFLTLSFLVTATSSAVTVWDEVSQGDLPSDFASPTDLGTLGLGGNMLSGTTTAGLTEDLTDPAAPHYAGIDADLWTVTVAPGQRLNQIRLTAFSITNPHNHTGGDGGVPGNGAFFGVQAGNRITGGVAGPPSELTGGGLIGILPGAQLGDDVLDDLGAGLFSALGVPTFSGPLEAGTYTFWYQEGPMDTEYTLDFQVTAVPEPTSLMGIGIMVLGAVTTLRVRRKKDHRQHGFFDSY